MTEDLLGNIITSYSSKYGKPTSSDSSNGAYKEHLNTNWDFPNYTISLDAKRRLFPLTIFQVDSKDKNMYKNHLEKYKHMNTLQKIKNNIYALNENFKGNTHSYNDIYDVSITYRSKYFDKQFSENIDNSIKTFLLQDSLNEIERIKKLKEKI